jgi:hypothetical protein
MAKYYNRNHVPKEFTVGQLVKLSTRNLRLKTAKLGPRWTGPFRITERIGAQAYRLALPAKYSRLHDVFPIQLLEEYRGRKAEGLLLLPDLEEPEVEWEVEEVRDTEVFDEIQHYLVKWVGWPSEYNTWEPIDHMKNASGAIRQFERGRKRHREVGSDRV